MRQPVLSFLTDVKTHAYIPCTKRPKTVVSHDLKNPPQPPKNEFAQGCSKRNSILKLRHFLEPSVLCDYEEKGKTMLFEVI